MYNNNSMIHRVTNILGFALLATCLTWLALFLLHNYSWRPESVFSFLHKSDAIKVMDSVPGVDEDTFEILDGVKFTLRKHDVVGIHKNKLSHITFKLIGKSAKDGNGGYVLYREGQKVMYIPGDKSFIDESLRCLIPDFYIQGADKLIDDFNPVGSRDAFLVTLELDFKPDGSLEKGYIWRHWGEVDRYYKRDIAEVPTKTLNFSNKFALQGSELKLNTKAFASSGAVRFLDAKSHCLDCTGAKAGNFVSSALRDMSQIGQTEVRGIFTTDDDGQQKLIGLRLGEDRSGNILVEPDLDGGGCVLSSNGADLFGYSEDVEAIRGVRNINISNYAAELLAGAHVDVLVIRPDGASEARPEDFKFNITDAYNLNVLKTLNSDLDFFTVE